ncbi:hypothetical protein BDD12DRAFT_930214 [Trichophaea hybrida]|nr:hypothetical protein BDD12DRAFT_930214 [Trichophaea hybrida]
MLHLSPLRSSTSTTAPPPSHLSAPTAVLPLSCPSAPTTAPLPLRPTAPKKRLTQLSFPFSASTVSNPVIRVTVVKRAKPLYMNRPRICRLLGISNDDHAVVNDYRDYIENDCIRRGQPFKVPYTPGRIQRTTSWRVPVITPPTVPTPLNEQLFPVPPIAAPVPVAPAPIVAAPSIVTPAPVVATPPIVAASPVVAPPHVIASPPVVAPPPVVATPAVGNSTLGTTPEGGQAFIEPSSESFCITSAHGYMQQLGMIQGRLPFAENNILMIPTNRATTSWKALDSEVWVWVRDDNDTAQVYFKVAGPDEWQSSTEDEEKESQIDPNVTLVCLLMLCGEALPVGHLVEKPIMRLTPRRSWLISNTKDSPFVLHCYHRTSAVMYLRSYHRTPPSRPTAPKQ